MGLVQVNRIKAKGVFYFIVCQDLQSALGLSEHLKLVVPNEFITVLSFDSREALMEHCNRLIIQ